jgi:hypothetical protein
MKHILSFAVLMFVWLGCSNDEGGTSHLKVMLTDAPGDYEEVNINIAGVEVHSAAGNQTTGWMALDVNSGVYNLLTLANGLDTLLGEIDLPAGRISQLRLILGTGNTLKVDGVVEPLTVPSGEQSGLKLNIQTDLAAGVTYVFTLDFDAARSIVDHGGTYSLKPVIRVVTEATSGSITGTIDPAAATPAVYAINGAGTVDADTVATTFADATGYFLLRGVPAGTYTVTFEPATGYTPVQKENIAVTIGQATDLGVVVIN